MLTDARSIEEQRTNGKESKRAVCAQAAGLTSRRRGLHQESEQAVQGVDPILVDGGIRRGTDVMKAIALGASAVLIGRPYVYALAAAGAAGIARVIEILTLELRMAMALAGRPTIASIDRSVLWNKA